MNRVVHSEATLCQRVQSDGLMALGFDSEQIETLSGLASGQPGLILFTGTCGQGKTTSLQALRQTLGLAEHVDIISQIQGAEAAAVVQGLLQAKLLVMSTMIAWSGFRALKYLRDKTSIPIADGVIRGCITQRLVPCLCVHCRVGMDEATEVSQTYLDHLATLNLDMNALRFRGSGCTKCNGLGLGGRLMVAEFLIPDETCLNLIGEGAFQAAYAYWRMGGEPALTAIDPSRLAGLTLLDKALEKVGQGALDPRDAGVDPLNDQPTREVARDFYRSFMTSRP